MKKTVMVLVLGAIISGVQAQDGKPGAGKMFGGGTIGLTRSTPMVPKGSPDPDATTNIVLSGSLGYFTKDDFAIGGRLSITKGMAADMDGDMGFGLGGFARKYWAITDNFYLYGEGTIGFSTYTPPYPSDADSPDGISTFGLGIAPGMGYYPGKKLGIEFSLAPVFSLSSKMQKDMESGLDFQLGVSTLITPTFTIVYFLK